MDGYLLDTCTVSAYWDGEHPFHAIAKSEVDALPLGAPRFVSRVTLAELQFGIALHEAATGKKTPKSEAILENAQSYGILEISNHTASEYAELRKNIAATYLARMIRGNRSRWIDGWVDRVTQEKLQIDENDVWICAQAREKNLILITTDEKMVARIEKADPLVRFRLLKRS